MPQNVNLLDDTIIKNVAFGIDDSKIDGNMVWVALEQVQLKDTIENSSNGLDTETEMAVMESIETLQGHKTLIIIAHRLTTIKNCDVIYEIADGKAILKNYKDLE